MRMVGHVECSMRSENSKLRALGMRKVAHAFCASAAALFCGTERSEPVARRPRRPMVV